MPPRVRVRKVGWRREDAALDAMKPFGFPTDLVKRKLKELLITYGDDGWIFIEEASYKLLIEVILEEVQNEEQGGNPTKLITNGDEAESSAALADAPHDAHGPIESPVYQVSAQSTNVGLNKDIGEEVVTSNKETVVSDSAQFAGGKQLVAGNVVLGVATSSGTNEANNVMKTINPKAAGTSRVDKPDDAPNNTGNGSVLLDANNDAGHIETDVKFTEFQRAQAPVKRTRKSTFGWYDGSEERDVIDTTQFTSFKLTSELSGGNRNGKETKSRWDLKPGI